MTTQYIIKNSEGTFYHKDKEMTIFHREDGPAIEYAGGDKSWWLDDKLVSEEEHKRLTTKEPTITIEGKAFTVEELKALIEKASI
jgi:hypothetical protein